jgi:hypothetical protein
MCASMDKALRFSFVEMYSYTLLGSIIFIYLALRAHQFIYIHIWYQKRLTSSMIQDVGS